MLRVSPQLLFFSKKKRLHHPQVSHAGSSSERAWQGLRAVYSLSPDPNLGLLPLSDHQKLEREARICRLLKHPNIGKRTALRPAACQANLPMVRAQFCCPPALPCPCWGWGGPHQ